VSGVKNPVEAARMVMEKSPHCFLQGPEATQFAREYGLELCNDDYFITPHRVAQLGATQAVHEDAVVLDHAIDRKTNKMGTVGAVVRDDHGNLASASSTGGMCNKWSGRIGDTPCIGAGIYVNPHVAVACTGLLANI